MTNHHSRRTVLKAAGTAGVAALAGCVSSAGSDGTPTETHHDHGGHEHREIEGPEASAEVRMITTEAGEHFDPHVVWIEEGATVTWVNESGSHSATAYAPANDRVRRIPEDAAAFDSELLSEAGAEFEHTFDHAGVYDYYCIPHEASGMIGSVIVGEPEAHDQPGLGEPQADLPEDAHEKLRDLNEAVTEALGNTHGAETASEDNHHDETATGHHEDDETATEHHDEDEDHHDDTATSTEHHDDEHDGTATPTDHHDG